MSFTTDNAYIIAGLLNASTELCKVLISEGAVTPADRLIETGNINKINDALGYALDQLSSELSPS